MPEQGNGGGDELWRAGAAWLEAWSRAVSTIADAMPTGDAAAPVDAATADSATADAEDGAQAPPSGDLADLARALATTQLAFATAGFDYSRKLMELQLRRGPKLGEPMLAALSEPARSGPAMGDAERQAVIEEARGYLRELAEITIDEARHFGRTLDEIDRELQRAAGGETAPSARRRWRAKA